MYLYNKYILKNLMAVFLLTVIFFTLLLFVFNIFKIARQVESGMEMWLVLKLLIYLVPYLLGFAIPFGALVASLLVYGGLSARNEVLALRASGVSLHRICWAAAMLGVVTFLLSLFFFGWVSPKGWFAARRELTNINPLFLFEPGETTEVSGYRIYLRRKSHDRIHDVVIYHVDKEGVTTRIGADSGTMAYNEGSGAISLALQNVETIMWEPDGRRLWKERDASMGMEFNLAQALEKATETKRESDMTFRELLARGRVAEEVGEEATPYLTAFNKRLVFSFACISFALMGAPLGMKVRRGEKTVGISIGLALAMSFYTAVMFAEKLSNKPGLHPQLLMWAPNAVLLLLAGLFFRNVRRRGA